MQDKLEQCIMDLSMLIQQEAHTMSKNELTVLKNELVKMETKLITLIDEVS